MEADLKLIQKEDGSIIIGALNDNGLNLLWTTFAFDNPKVIKRKLTNVDYDRLRHILSEMVENCDPKLLYVNKIWCMADGTVYMVRFTNQQVEMDGIEVYQ